MTRPLILVTCRRRRLPTFLGARTTLDTLDPVYADRISQAGGQPLPRGDWACVGVQWHPEKMTEPEQRVLFERLVDDARLTVAQTAGLAV